MTDVVELRRFIESRGYDLKSIRVYSKSFHVIYWDAEAKYRRIYKMPIETVPIHKLWHEYPPIKKGEGK